MTLDPTAPADYLVAHLEDALGRDERVCEQGLHVTVVDSVVTVRGVVSTDARWRAVADVVGDLLPTCSVRNEATVADLHEDPAVERVEPAS